MSVNDEPPPHEYCPLEKGTSDKEGIPIILDSIIVYAFGKESFPKDTDDRLGRSNK